MSLLETDKTLKSKKQSICFFSHSSDLYGAERCLIDLIKILISKGIHCTMVMPDNGPLKILCEELNIPVKTYIGFSWWCSKEKPSQETIFKNIMIILQNNFKKITDFIKENSTNVIYSQTVVSPLGAIFAEYLNLPHFWGIREFGKIEYKFSFGFKMSMEALFKTSQLILSVSETVSKVVLDKNHFNENVKINYVKVNIHDIFSNSYFKPFKEIIKIGIFGTINQNKNQLDIIKSTLILLQKGYKIKLFIVGSWDIQYYKLLNQYIKSSYYSDNIVFIGNTENPFEIMKDMNIVVSCSISEGFGRTLIEAILLKIPIIHTNTGTPKEIFKNYENGLAYKLYDELNLSDKIIYTIQNIDQTIKRVEKAYNYINSYFTEEKYSQPIIDALNKINQTTFYREKKYVSNLVLSNNLEKKIRIKQNYLNELLANKSIKKVFFGASSVLEKNFNILKNLNIIPDYICDNDTKKHKQYFKNYEIISPSEVFEQNETFLVFITSSYVNEIKKQLASYNNIHYIDSCLNLLNTITINLDLRFNIIIN